ncbi:hypothetical protein KAZ82_00970 [Candidatus Babeliales bacterium]|nr:hypothetical protein [Candidatus Babeliales bacterium]
MNKHLSLFISSLQFSVKNLVLHPWFWWKLYIWTIFSVAFGFIVPVVFFMGMMYFFANGGVWLRAHQAPELTVYLLSAVLLVGFIWLLFRSLRHMASLIVGYMLVTLNAAENKPANKASMMNLADYVSNRTVLRIMTYLGVFVLIMLGLNVIFGFGIAFVCKILAISYECKITLHDFYFTAVPFELLWFVGIGIQLFITWCLARLVYGFYYVLQGTITVRAALQKSIALTYNQWGIIPVFVLCWYVFEACIDSLKHLSDVSIMIPLILLILFRWVTTVIGPLMIARSYVLMKK